MIDKTGDELRAAMRQAMKVCHVPDSLHGGLERYFVDRILPGSFLQAVLCNDLAEACRRADPVNVLRLGQIVEFLEGYVSPAKWGSQAKVLAWTLTPDRFELPRETPSPHQP